MAAPKKKPTLRAYEGSAADKRADTANMKKTGMKPAQYEGSAMDRKADAAGLKAMQAKVAKKPAKPKK